jgi:hypothetical protein
MMDHHHYPRYYESAYALSGFRPERLKTIQTTQTDSLYPRMVGQAAWANLSEPVRRLHKGTVQGTGRFTIRRGERATARLLARLLSLPSAGTDVPVRLTITRHARGERWARTFGADTPLVTEQWAGAGGLVIEHVGPTEVLYRLEVAGGALYYRHVGTALRLGPIRLPLPRWLAPRIAARESALPDEKLTHISVEVSHALTGRLVSYKGFIEIQG